MRHLTLAALTTLLALISLATTPASADSYRVTIEPAEPRLAHVEAELTPASGGRLLLTRNASDSGIEGGWARFLERLEVRDSKGGEITVEEGAVGEYLVGESATPLSVRYSMRLEHDRVENLPGADELAWARPEAVFWTGRALFLEGEPTTDIEVAFVLPAGWRATTPWEVLEPGRRYRTADVDALLDSGFIVGEHFEARLGGGDAPVRIALAGPGAVAASEAVVDTVQRYTERFAALFGGPAEGRLLLVAADGGFWGGGVMGTTISMMLGGALDASTLPMLRFVTVHEAFHLWNANFNYRGTQGGESLYWLSEGSASYYALRAQLGVGDLPAETALQQLADETTKYRAVRGDLDMVAAGPTKLEHYDLIYSGGFVATMALDLAIRTRSKDRHSLDDVMRSLHSGTGRETALDVQSFTALVESTTGVSVVDLVDCCIEGTEELPITELLAALGLRLGAGGGAATIARDPEATPEARRRWAGWPLG